MSGAVNVLAGSPALRLLVEHLRDEILVLDGEFQTLYASPSARPAGLPAGPGEGTWLDRVHPEDQGHARALKDELLSRPGVALPFELRVAGPCGSWQKVDGIATNLLDREIGGIVVSRRVVPEPPSDQAQRTLLSAEIEKAQRLGAVARVAGRVAHDLNNLLGAILGYSYLLASESTTTANRHESAKHLEDVVARARSLVAELQELGRPVEGRPERLDLNEVLRGLEPLIGLLAGPGIELLLLRVEGPLPLTCPRLALEQAVINLVLNARDAMPAGGRIELATSVSEFSEPLTDDRGAVAAGRYATLSVRDTGVGMDAETRRRMFEPFFTTKDAGRGTGLGLAIVDDLVAVALGSIQVESAPGEGSRFDLHLPLAADASCTPI